MDLDGLNGCWRRSPRGCDQLTCHLDLGHQRLLNPSLPCPWNLPSASGSHCGSQLQGRRLKRAMCCWDHLDGVQDWTVLRPLFRLLRFWRVGAIYSSQASYKSSLVYYTYHLPSWSCLFFFFFLCRLSLLCTGPVSDFTWEIPEVSSQHWGPTDALILERDQMCRMKSVINRKDPRDCLWRPQIQTGWPGATSGRPSRREAVSRKA